MTGAIIGLVGVVVGGLLTAGVQILQDWRAERTLSRAAARLLSAELSVQLTTFGPVTLTEFEVRAGLGRSQTGSGA
jgi:hypothetical protein